MVTRFADYGDYFALYFSRDLKKLFLNFRGNFRKLIKSGKTALTYSIICSVTKPSLLKFWPFNPNYNRLSFSLRNRSNAMQNK